MKSNTFFYILILIIGCCFKSEAFNKQDSSRVKTIEIMSYYFDRTSRVGLNEFAMLRLRDSNRNEKLSFYKMLGAQESLKLEEKLTKLLVIDTINGIIDNNMDLRFLMVLNYENNKPSIYIGIDAIGRMFINGKRYKCDKVILSSTLEYISHKGIKRTIINAMKKW